MKHFIFILGLFFFYLNSYAQFGDRQEIASLTAGPFFLEDLDGDNYMDLVIGLYDPNSSVKWYKNINGNGPFQVQQPIATSLWYTQGVHATDIDGDGYVDVLTVSNVAGGQSNRRLAWYKNLDGQGNFGPERLISSMGSGNYILIDTVDIDGDGDTDVLVSGFATNYSQIGIFKNLDGLGNFGQVQNISSGSTNAESIFTADIDGDDDIDVIVASSDGAAGLEKVIWYENDGNGFFGLENIITTNLNRSISAIATDVENDGDMDIITASLFDDKVGWFENLNGEGIFSSQQIISTNSEKPLRVHTMDVDQDNDIDVISSSYGPNGKLVWYENNGVGIFGTEQVIDSNIWIGSTVTKDLDGNGTIDIVTGLSGDFFWYENQVPLSINENIINSFSITPIPATNTITIEPKLKIDEVLIYNNLGVLISEFSKQNILNIENLEAGVYYANIRDIYGNTSMTKIIKF